MSNVYAKVGDIVCLQAHLDQLVYDDLRLFKNNHVPTVDDVAGDYTEANFSGYGGSVTPTWSAPAINGAGKGEIESDPITYTHNGGGTSNTIYGAYLLDSAGVLVYADKFSAPIVMGVNGDTFDYTAKTTAVTE